MKLSFKLALSYLVKQKGRSLSLITSIALAVILVFTLNVIPETKSEINIKEAYKNFSDYHVEYNDLSKEIVDKLQKDKDVKRIQSTLNFGDLVSQSGVSISLNSYNKNFIEEYGYKVIKGKNPVNEDEIIIEEKALKEMGLNNELNQMIDFTIVKKYIDEDSKNQIYSDDVKLKLVGIIQKPENYYKNNDYYKIKAFVNAKETNDFIPLELVRYNGILKFNGKSPNMSMTYKKIGEYKLNDSNFMINSSLREVLENYQASKDTKFSKINKLIPMISASLVIYNIFNIILIDMTKQIGMLRAIGLSKKKVKYMLLIQGLIVLIIGLTLGYMVGILFSIIGTYFIYGYPVKLYISKSSIIEPMIMASVAVIISMIFIMYKSGKIEPIEAIRFTSISNKVKKDKMHCKLVTKTFKVTSQMAFKNIVRDKSKTILSVLSISLAGVLFISNMAVYNNKDLDNTSMVFMTMGDSDVILGKDSQNTESRFTYYSEKEIKEISKIEEINKIEKSINLDGYLSVGINNLNKSYRDISGVKMNKEDNELSLKIKGYDDKGLQGLDKFIEDGSNIINLANDKYPSVLVSNNYYSPQSSSNDAKILKKINVNDLIDIKIPVNENCKLKYVNQKVRVKGILNKDYVVDHNGGMEGCVQIILSDRECKNITKALGYNNIALSIEKNSDEKVIKKIEEITKNSSFVDIESKYGYSNYFKENIIENKKEVLVSVILTLLISSINIICIIRTNIRVRMNEIATLRAIGMSVRKIKIMIIKESLIYGVFSIILASAISTLDYYKFIKMVNFGYEQGFGKENRIIFSLPGVEIAQFSVITIIICLVAVYISKTKIEKLSIVEGLRDNE